MKRIFAITTLALSVMLSVSINNKALAQVDASISYQTFYDELSPYGQWMDYPDYGYVWVPDLGAGFQPYSTGGHWVWSDEYEWMWVSDYSWGWAPFHYGRWFYDTIYGWVWVPGYDWSPAWVSWRTGGDYYGWAPIMPGIDISLGFDNYNYPSHYYWCFVPKRYIASSNIGNYYADRSLNTTIFNNTSIINHKGNRNNIFVNGPRRDEVERHAGRITPVSFRASDRPGGRELNNNQVSLYRPQVQRDNNKSIAPKNFDRYDKNNRNDKNAIGRNNSNLPQSSVGNDRKNTPDRNANRPATNNNQARDAKPATGTRSSNTPTRSSNTPTRSSNTPQNNNSKPATNKPAQQPNSKPQQQNNRPATTAPKTNTQKATPKSSTPRSAPKAAPKTTPKAAPKPAPKAAPKPTTDRKPNH